VSAGTVPERQAAEEAAGERLEAIWSEKPGLVGWASTVDHKKIGRRYMVTAGVFFALSGTAALVMRTQLARPESALVSPALYDQLFSLHGTTMIFFFATPMLFGFGNFLFPLMLGTRDMAFPRLNAFGYWVFLFAGLVMFGSLLFDAAPNAGWFAYVPLSSERYSPGHNLDVYTVGVLFLGISTTVGAINFIVTAFKLRATGMSMFRVPVFVWSVVATSFMVVFALPPLNLANAMLFADRRFGAHFFDPAKGGDAVLWQHLFWIFGHPDVYIIVLPALGIVSSVIPVFSRRPIAAYPLIVVATVATAFIAFCVWVHHMFAVGLPQLSLSFFSAASIIVTIPSGIQMFAWIATMRWGRVVLRTPMLYAIGFLIVFVLGGVTGVMFALVAFDQQVTDSYFVVAHFHYVLFGGAVFPIMAGLYHWWPKFTGRMYSEALGRLSFVLVFVGANLTFFPMHLSGLLGMPRRVYTYPGDLGWNLWNLLATIGAYILAVGLLTIVVDFVRSLRRGPRAPDDPWGGDTLEWATASPPEHYNFAVLPSVHSLHPMWDERSRSSLARYRDDEERVLADGHQVLRTSELDGDLEQPIEMPSDTVVPLVTAGGMLIGVIGLLVAAYYVAAAGALVLIAGLVTWLWPRTPAPGAAR
jgi:cytochrome c oxidase subunit 1/cytochrome c oxidase subunit I+III